MRRRGGEGGRREGGRRRGGEGGKREGGEGVEGRREEARGEGGVEGREVRRGRRRQEGMEGGGKRGWR